MELLERHGKAVEQKTFANQQEVLEEILLQLQKGSDYETTAVLTMTEQEALEAYGYLKERLGEVSYIDRNSSAFQRGITVTTFYLAKGLEFDRVFVLGRKEKTGFCGRRNTSVQPGRFMSLPCMRCRNGKFVCHSYQKARQRKNSLGG